MSWRVVDGIRRGRGGRWPAGAGVRGGVAAAVLCAAAVAAPGCSATVGGQASPAAGVEYRAPGQASAPASPPPASSAPPSAVPSTPSGPPGASSPGTSSGALDRLLPEPADFPAGFADSAAVLPHRDAVAAAEDLSGVHRGARTSPVQCAPGAQPPGADDMALMSSTDPASRSTIAVQLERVPDELSDYRSTIEACTEVQAEQFGAPSQVTRSVRSQSEIAGTDVVAFDQTVRSGQGTVALEQRSTTLAAQVDGVRVVVVGMNQRGEPPAAAELEGLLAQAVDSVRAG